MGAPEVDGEAMKRDGSDADLADFIVKGKEWTAPADTAGMRIGAVPILVAAD